LSLDDLKSILNPEKKDTKTKPLEFERNFKLNLIKSPSDKQILEKRYQSIKNEMDRVNRS